MWSRETRVARPGRKGVVTRDCGSPSVAIFLSEAGGICSSPQRCLCGSRHVALLVVAGAEVSYPRLEDDSCKLNSSQLNELQLA